MADLSGINLAMHTPFTESGAIDLPMWEALIDQYVEAGVHGLVLGSGTGQHPYLTEAECNRLYEVGVRRVNGRCNVICQSSALNVDEVLRRSRQAESAGAQALMVLPPYFEGPTDDDGLFAFYAELDAAVGIDIVGYNIPQSTGISVSLPLLNRLATLRNFNYIKDSGGDMVVHQSYLRSGFKVLNGADPTAVYAFMAGACGAIWGAANFMPHACVKLWNLVQQQRHAEALALWQTMLPSLLIIWNERYVPTVVRAAQLRGFGTGRVRKPLRPLNATEDAALRTALQALQV